MDTLAIFYFNRHKYVRKNISDIKLETSFNEKGEIFLADLKNDNKSQSIKTQTSNIENSASDHSNMTTYFILFFFFLGFILYLK